MNTSLAGWLSCLVLFATLSTGRGQDDQPAQRQVAIGLTRRGEAIQAHLPPDATTLEHRGARIIIIGGHDADPASTAVVEQLREDLLRAEAAAKHKTPVAFVPNVYPSGLAQGVADEDATRGYPPENGYYNDAARPESRYLWRWVTTYGADLVIDVRTGKDAGYWLPKARATDWLDSILARDWKPLPAPAGDDFAVQLATKGAAELGATATLILQIPPAGKATAFKKLHLLLQLAQTLDRSAARSELLLREQRQPHEVAAILTKAYPQDRREQLLPDLTASIELLQHYPGVLGRYYDGWLEDAQAAYDFAERYGYSRSTSGESDYMLAEKRRAQHAVVVREMYSLAVARRTGRRLEDTWTLLAEQIADPAAASLHGPEAIFTTSTLFVRCGTGPYRQTQYLDAAVNHYRAVRTACRRRDGLYRQGPQGELAWGQSNGLAAMGLALVLSSLPSDHPAAEELRTDLQRHVAVLLKQQEAFGGWRQVLDQPGSYSELGATCLIAWTLKHGLDRGWWEEAEHQAALQRAWRAVLRRIGPDGQLVDVCPLGPEATSEQVRQSPAVTGNDRRGAAIALLLSAELLLPEKRLK